MNYPGVSPVQNSQYSSQYGSNMMPPPNNYPKMSSAQMYPPRLSQSIMPPGQHSYPTHPGQHPLTGAPHQYPQNYNKMYFNGFLPYPQQLPYPPAGYPNTGPHPDYPTIDNHLPPTSIAPPVSSSQQQQQLTSPGQKSINEFNGNQQSEVANNNNNFNSTGSTDQNAISNESSVSLNSSLNKNSQQSPVPNAIDEASQTSTSSSSHNDDRTETPKLGKQHSHPTTPNPLGSPSNVSMSSLQDEYDNSSNPSWPRTPASPVVNSEHSKNKVSFHLLNRDSKQFEFKKTLFIISNLMPQKGENLQKLYEMSDEPDRRAFLDKLISFNDKHGIKMNTCPHISKTLIDLFKLYNHVKDRGGFADVTKKKLWKECANLIKMPIASTTSYSLRKAYIKYLLPFECKFDRNGIDPEKLLSSLESTSKKKTGKNASASPQPVDTNSQSSYPQATTPQLNTSNNQPSSKTQSPNLQSPNFQNVPTQPNLLPNQMSPYHLQQQQQIQQNQQMKLNEEAYQRKMASLAQPPTAPPNQKAPVDYYSNYDAYNRSGKNIHPVANLPHSRPANLQQPGQNYPPAAHLPADGYHQVIVSIIFALNFH